MSILAISVVLAITLATISLTIKQTQLATDSRDSEVAFHAASAGLECVRHWRRFSAEEYEDGQSVPINCFRVNSVSPDNAGNHQITSDVEGDGEVYNYTYRISWGVGQAERCSEMKFILLVTDFDGSGLTLENVSEYITGYPRADDTKECESGGLCTIFSSRGYSTSCPAAGENFPIGTVQRDIYIEF